MNVYRVGIRDMNGNKFMIEVNNTASHALARDFVLRETKAPVVLALVNPVEQTVFEEPEQLQA